MKPIVPWGLAETLTKNPNSKRTTRDGFSSLHFRQWKIRESPQSSLGWGKTQAPPRTSATLYPSRNQAPPPQESWSAGLTLCFGRGQLGWQRWARGRRKPAWPLDAIAWGSGGLSTQQVGTDSAGSLVQGFHRGLTGPNLFP